MIVVVSSLRYDDAIVLPRTDKESTNLMGMSLAFSFSLNIILLLIIMVTGKRIMTFLNLPESFPFPVLFLIPLSAFLYSSYQSLNYWLIRKKKFYSISLNKLLRRSSEGISQVSLAILKKSNGLIYSDAIGQSVNVMTVLVQTYKNGLTFNVLSLNKLRYVFKKYSDFPKYNLLPAFMGTCSFMLPPVLINKFFSPEFAGYFDLAKLLLSVPLALVATSFSNVLLQRISEKYNRKASFLSDIKPIILLVLIISMAEIVIIMLFGENLFKILFGDVWIYSGKISRILVWSFTFNFIVSTFTIVYISLRKIRIYSIFQVIYFLAILTLLFFKNLAFVEFIKIYVFIEIACYSILSVITIFIVMRYENSLKIVHI